MKKVWGVLKNIRYLISVNIRFLFLSESVGCRLLQVYLYAHARTHARTRTGTQEIKATNKNKFLLSEVDEVRAESTKKLQHCSVAMLPYIVLSSGMLYLVVRYKSSNT